MRDLIRPGAMYTKTLLFVALGIVAAGLIVMRSPSLQTAALLVIAVWAFARAYYFAFYVIEHYIDGSFRYSGLWSCLMHLRRQRRRGAQRPLA
jgi:hypothetical protein